MINISGASLNVDGVKINPNSEVSELDLVYKEADFPVKNMHYYKLVAEPCLTLTYYDSLLIEASLYLTLHDRVFEGSITINETVVERPFRTDNIECVFGMKFIERIAHRSLEKKISENQEWCQYASLSRNTNYIGSIGISKYPQFWSPALLQNLKIK